MKKKICMLALALTLSAATLVACGSGEATETTTEYTNEAETREVEVIPAEEITEEAEEATEEAEETAEEATEEVEEATEEAEETTEEATEEAEETTEEAEEATEE